jgi:exosortase A-associated hydrolase 2
MPVGQENVGNPVFLEGPAGRIFALYHPPAPGANSRGALVYVPPFAEEMNRSRRMAALQARALASRGVGVLVLDLFGTGDSGGEFREGRLSLWLGDVVAAADWLNSKGHATVGLWGLRFGALLAVIAAGQEPGRYENMLLWQPVVDGKTMLNQFLRIGVAASMGEAGNGKSSEALRAELAGGRSVEIAGYELSPELAQALSAARMEGMGASCRVLWLEVAEQAGDPLLPVSQRVVESWRQSGAMIAAKTVAGPQFWTTQETTVAPSLIDVTTTLFEFAPT